MAYSLPREAFALLESAFNDDREKAETFARAIEASIQSIEDQAEERIGAKKEAVKAELYNELRGELATKEFVRAENNELRAEIRRNALLLKVLIGIAVFGLALFNPSLTPPTPFVRGASYSLP